MYIEPKNPIVHKLLGEFLQKGLEHSETVYEFDNCQYLICGTPDGKAVYFAFKSNCPAVLAPLGKEMVKELYPEYECPESEYAPDYDITLKITKEDWSKTKKVKKDMDEETKAQLREENEVIKAEN